MRKQLSLFEMPWVPTQDLPEPDCADSEVSREMVSEFVMDACHRHAEGSATKGKLWWRFWDWALHAHGCEWSPYDKRKRAAFDWHMARVAEIFETPRKWHGLEIK